jgi:hypothetical protein
MGVEALPRAFSVLSGGIGGIDEKRSRLLWRIFLNDRDSIALDECDLLADTLDVSDAFSEGLSVPAGLRARSLLADSRLSCLWRERGPSGPE